MNKLKQKLEEYLLHPIGQGGRNDALFSAAVACKCLGMGEGEAMLTLEGKAAGDGLKLGEIKKTIASAFSQPADVQPSGFQDSRPAGRIYKWDDSIQGGSRPPDKVVQVRPGQIPDPKPDWEAMDLVRLLRSCFQEGERIGYNVQHRLDENGKAQPISKGIYTRTREQLIQEAMRAGTAEAILCDHNKGAWIRINPLDGQGVADSNVTSYRHTLVESDDMPLEKQLAIYTELRLPVGAIIHSGSKSVHAWVRVDAADKAEYQKRTEYLYLLLEKQGFAIDLKNKNPSRLSRLPGVEREGQAQYLISTRAGASSWAEWVEWIESSNDDLPAIDNTAEYDKDPAELSPELIYGVLRQGHKFIISGPSKAGKSFYLIGLSIALANGSQFLGMQCKPCRVLVLNFEIDRPSYMHRVDRVRSAMAQGDNGQMDVWNLRGHAVGIEDLAPKIIRRIKEKGYGALVIDPIYKLLGADRDENKAGDIADFLNHLDAVAVRAGVSIIMAHHFSKGSQGGKAVIDRMSGSGVFARDPDAVVTLTELENFESCYKMEFVLREFKSPEPRYMRFEYPTHREDPSLDGEKTQGEKGRRRSVTDSQLLSEFLAMKAVRKDYEVVSLKELADSLGRTDRTLRTWIENMAPQDGQVLRISRGNLLLESVGDDGGEWEKNP